MKGKKDTDSLRKRAEERLARKKERPGGYSTREAAEIIHELQVHQIELEIQNEELRKTQEDLTASRDRFLRLFHGSPVGYIVLDESGVIVETNETFCRMAGREAERLKGKGFSEIGRAHV